MTVNIHQPTSAKAISITECASQHVLAQMTQQPNAIGFRLSVKEAGCTGFMYVVELINEIDATDHCFAVHKDFSIYVDKKSFPFVAGTNIDFVKEGINELFVYNNPNEETSCGCGESFHVKDDSNE